jgi:hypothetical protein
MLEPWSIDLSAHIPSSESQNVYNVAPGLEHHHGDWASRKGIAVIRVLNVLFFSRSGRLTQ